MDFIPHHTTTLFYIYIYIYALVAVVDPQSNLFNDYLKTGWKGRRWVDPMTQQHRIQHAKF